MCDTEDDDWFRFSLTGQATITSTFDPAVVDIRMEFLDSDGDIVSTTGFDTGTGEERMIQHLGSPEVFSLRVFAASGVCGTYDLDLTYPAGP